MDGPNAKSCDFFTGASVDVELNEDLETSAFNSPGQNTDMVSYR